MKNQFIIPSIIIAAAILGGFWMLKPPAELPEAPDISIHDAAIVETLNWSNSTWLLVQM